MIASFLVSTVWLCKIIQHKWKHIAKNIAYIVYKYFSIAINTNDLEADPIPWEGDICAANDVYVLVVRLQTEIYFAKRATWFRAMCLACERNIF